MSGLNMQDTEIYSKVLANLESELAQNNENIIDVFNRMGKNEKMSLVLGIIATEADKNNDKMKEILDHYKQNHNLNYTSVNNQIRQSLI